MEQQLINIKHCKDYALRFAQDKRKGWNPQRVSKQFLEDINIKVMRTIQHAIAHHPTIGKTIKEVTKMVRKVKSFKKKSLIKKGFVELESGDETLVLPIKTLSVTDERDIYIDMEIEIPYEDVIPMRKKRPTL